MTLSFSVARCRAIARVGLAAAMLLACVTSPALAQQSGREKNVLALYWYSREYPSNVQFERGLLRALRSGPQGGPEYYSEYLEIDRFPPEEHTRVLRDFLLKKYAHLKIDVIVAEAEEPLKFLLANRNLFPGVPIVYNVLGPSETAGRELVPGTIGIFGSGAYRKTVDLARTIHPGTEQVLVINSLPNHGGEARARIVRQELALLEGEVKFKYLTDLPTDVLLEEVAKAPPRSIVLYGRHSAESLGSVLDPIEGVSLLSRSTKAPIYSVSSTYMGHGIVGGYLIDLEAIGAQAGQLALQLLAGKPVGEMSPVNSAVLLPVFDWGEMQRWQIDPSRLPPGSDVRFRVPTAWDQYRWYIVGALALVGIQSTMIAALMIQRSRRRSAEAQNVAILRAMPDMMFLLNRKGVYVDFYAPDKGTLLVSPDQFLGRNMHDVLPAGLATSLDECFARLKPGDPPAVLEYTLDLPGGERQYEARVVPSRDDHMLAVVRDITERKQAETALSDSQQRYALATAAGGVGVWDWDLETNDVYVDPSLKANLGYADNEISNHLGAWLQLVHRDDRTAILARALEYLDGRSATYEVEHRTLHRDGSSRWILKRGSVVRRDGRPVRIIGTDTDITERKRSEQVLHEAQSDLLRLSRLTALGEFAASIAHEVRQPLSAILMNTKTCLRWLERPTPDLVEVRAALTDVVDAGRRADEVIKRNRELFRHHTVQKAALDINDVIRDVEALVRARLHVSHVALVTALSVDLPWVNGDPVELQQVLLNLVANSIDAMDGIDPESRRIDVSSSLGPDGNVKVSVKDNGIGLNGVDLQQMFTLSYTTKASGTGVGLSISRSIVEAHGGQLWAEQNAGRGATFSFTVPVYSAVAAT